MDFIRHIPLPAHPKRSEIETQIRAGLRAVDEGQLVAASTAFLRSIEGMQQCADLWNNLGVCLARLKQFDGAREALEVALQLDPTNATASRNMRELEESTDTQSPGAAASAPASAAAPADAPTVPPSEPAASLPQSTHSPQPAPMPTVGPTQGHAPNVEQRPWVLGRENLHSRSKAQTVALVRGWGQTHFTERCLASLVRHTTADDLRIIYVDNGSDVDAFCDLVRKFPRVEFVRMPSNQGSCRAINLGMLLAGLEEHEFVLLMDNDAAVPHEDSGWLKRWVACFDDTNIGAAGAVSDVVAGAQHMDHVPWTYNAAWQQQTEEQGSAGLPKVPVLVSFAMMMRSEALASIGWLADERFEPGNSEDFDLCLRMNEQGWQHVIAQSVWIHHTGSQTFKHFDVRELLRNNREKLVDKYGPDKLRALGVRV